VCVTNADEMAELVAGDPPPVAGDPALMADDPPPAATEQPPSRRSAPISPAIDPTGTRVRVLDALSDRSGRSVTRIGQLTGLAADRVRAELGLLELEGIVRELPAGWQKFTVKQLDARRG